MSILSFRSSALFAALFIGVAAHPTALQAQQNEAAKSGDAIRTSSGVTPSTPVATADHSALAGPRVAPAGITKPVQTNPLGVAEPQDGGAHIGAGSNLAMMGAGAAGIVVGLLIGGDGGTIIALGGGVIGLVGSYRYLR